MRVNEIEGREEFVTVLAVTLTRHLSALFGRNVTVSTRAVPGAQAWKVQPMLSAIYAGPLVPSARRFLADGFRYTPVAARVPAQWLLGTLLASSLGLRLTGRNVLWISPDVPHATSVVVVPGNRRVRWFDFTTGRSRVLLKHGYAPDAILNEIRIRGTGTHGPFPAIDAYDPAGSWFEEPILHGFALPRCPPWRDRAAYEREAVALLDRWLENTSAPASIEDHVAAIVMRIRDRAPRLEPRANSSTIASCLRVAERLAAKATAMSHVVVATSHGDFQPGNVIVEDTGRVLLTDWEHSGMRSREYDLFVWALRSRYPAGLVQRIRTFAQTGRSELQMLRDIGGAAARYRALALFLLEEIEWQIADALEGSRRSLAPCALEILRASEQLALKIER